MATPDEIFFGPRPLPARGGAPSGRLVHDDGEDWYVIDDAQALPPFLVSLVSDSDHWLFASSNGALTAGRRSPANALFPYVTEDKLVDSAGVTGPLTSLVVTRDGRAHLWRPLRDDDRLVYPVTRRLAKTVLGHRLAFEEDNHELGLRFRAEWRTSHRFGFVRECRLENLGAGPAHVRLLDGLTNLLPGDLDESLQLSLSCLLDAYKRHERVGGTTLALYTLAAQVVDRPEPREALHATVAWSVGLPGARVLLSREQAAGFDRGAPSEARDEVRGRRGAYLLEADLALPARASRAWSIIADPGRTQAEAAALARSLRDPAGLDDELRRDLAAGADALARMVASLDGVQVTADREGCAHHVANVVFNAMRGGAFPFGVDVPGPDFAVFVRRANLEVWHRHEPFLRALAELEPRRLLAARVAERGDAHLERLLLEYLPLAFSRRHGDPSRPWNRFDIEVKDATGKPRLAWSGNWRDIFQNWEALSRSFPDAAVQFVAKLVDASTPDGHNPYRIGKDGLDWEVPDPGHPWATIGYWGDHQIVYLLRLLESACAHTPAEVARLLERPLFTYADVPYRLVPWAEMIAHPRSTITFDGARHAAIVARERELGSDARLVAGPDGLPLRVTLLEKLLVPALAKLASFVPGGGIWMNTQRPEWNDANNALVGYGVSMVTLCHLERYLAFVSGLLEPLRERTTPVSREVASWIDATLAVLQSHADVLARPEVDDLARERVMRALGEAATAYRTSVYDRGLSVPVGVPVSRLLELHDRALTWLRHTLARASRPDGLFHSYNLIAPRAPGGGIGLEHLSEMLEGQVAALGASSVGPHEAVALLRALRASALYRPDQRSYILYPDRRLPRFLDKNVVPEDALERAPLLRQLLAAGDARVILRDADGHLRFAPSCTNAEACRAALAADPTIDAASATAVLAEYERVFNHHAFTGRSGTMFAYEGLGSIYWHMVGKLLLAVQERALSAADARAPVAGELMALYRDIRAGMGGCSKPVAVWGAFPLDPYSHTPAGSGARQPGMTGQVKEELLTRLGELGVVVRDGRVSFRPVLLPRAELLPEPSSMDVLDVDGTTWRLELPAGTLAFTLCQVPVVYHHHPQRRIVVTTRDATLEVSGDTLDADPSATLFARAGKIRRLDVFTPIAAT